MIENEPISRAGASYSRGTSATEPVQYHTHNGIDSPELDISTDPAGNDQEIQYNDNGVFGADPNFKWNSADKALELGAVPTEALGDVTYIRTQDLDGSDDPVDIQIQGGSHLGVSGSGANISINAGIGATTGDGGTLGLSAGASVTGDGGDVFIDAGYVNTSGVGGSVNITAGNSAGSNKDGADINLTLGAATGSGTKPKLRLATPTHALDLKIDSISGAREYHFPDVGTGFHANVLSTTADDTAANTTSQTLLTPDTWAVYKLWKVGRVFRITAMGHLSTAAAAPDLTMELFVGGSTTLPLSTNSNTLPANLTDTFWTVEALVTCRTVGTSGTAQGTGKFEFMDADQGTPTVWYMGNETTSTFNNSSLNFNANLYATWDTADTDNTITCTQFLVESIG